MDRALDIANDRVPRFACKPGISRSDGLPAKSREPKERNGPCQKSLLPKASGEGWQGSLRLKRWRLTFGVRGCYIVIGG